MPDDLTGVLNRLLAACEDGAEGYRAVGRHADDEAVRSWCRRRAEQREQFAADLRRLVTQHGGEAADAGHPASALHRGWIGLKAALTDGDGVALLRECERGDKAAVETYQAALAGGLPDDLAPLVQAQQERIEAALREVCAWLGDTAV